MAASMRNDTSARVRELLADLTSPTRTSSSQSNIQNESSGANNELTKCALSKPLNRGLFWDRVATFQTMTWFGKPEKLSPLECSRFGWMNIANDTLQCVSCRAFITGRMPKTSQPAVYEKCLEKLVTSLKSGHHLSCPWTNNPSPEDFRSIIPVDRGECVRHFRERFGQLCSLGAVLPNLGPNFLTNDLGLTDHNLQDVIGQCIEDLMTTDSNVQHTSAALTLTGWKNSESKAQILECDVCQREVGLWNFVSLDQDPSDDDEEESDEPSEKRARNEVNEETVDSRVGDVESNPSVISANDSVGDDNVSVDAVAPASNVVAEETNTMAEETNMVAEETLVAEETNMVAEETSSGEAEVNVAEEPESASKVFVAEGNLVSERLTESSADSCADNDSDGTQEMSDSKVVEEEMADSKVVADNDNNDSLKLDSDNNEEIADIDKNEETVDIDKNEETTDIDKNEEITDIDNKEEVADIDKNEETTDNDKNEETTDIDKNEETTDIDMDVSHAIEATETTGLEESAECVTAVEATDDPEITADDSCDEMSQTDTKAKSSSDVQNASEIEQGEEATEDLTEVAIEATEDGQAETAASPTCSNSDSLSTSAVTDGSLATEFHAVEQQSNVQTLSEPTTSELQGQGASTSEEENGQSSRKRLRKRHKVFFHPLQEHKTWCPWVSKNLCGYETEERPDWKRLYDILMQSTPKKVTNIPNHNSPAETIMFIRHLFNDWTTP